MAETTDTGTVCDETVRLRTVDASGNEVMAAHVGTASIHDLSPEPAPADPKTTRRTKG